MDCVIPFLMMKLYFTVETDRFHREKEWSVHFGERKKTYFSDVADYPSV